MVDDGKHLLRPIVRVADIYLVWHQSGAIMEVHGRDMQSYGSKIDTCALFPSSHYQTDGKKKRRQTTLPSQTGLLLARRSDLQPDCGSNGQRQRINKRT